MGDKTVWKQSDIKENIKLRAKFRYRTNIAINELEYHDQ